MYNCSGLALCLIVSNKLEMSTRFPETGLNDIGMDVPLCPDAEGMAVLVLVEVTSGAANNVVRPPLSIFRRLGSGEF